MEQPLLIGVEELMGGKTDKVSVLHRFLIRKVSNNSLSVHFIYKMSQIERELLKKFTVKSTLDEKMRWRRVRLSPRALFWFIHFGHRAQRALVFSVSESLSDHFLFPKD